MLAFLSRLSLARQLLVLQVSVAGVVILVGAVLAYLDARRDSVEVARTQVRTLAEALAQEPSVRTALQTAAPQRRLQPLAESVRLATAVDFVVFLSPEGIRYSHPNPQRIGEPFVGTIAPAVAGQTFTERFTGTLGRSVRAVAPVAGDPGPGESGPDESQPLGLVAVGITEQHIAEELLEQLPALLAVVALVLGLAAAGSALVSRRLHRLTHGLGPAEMTRLYEHHDAVLHAVREGLLVVNRQGVVVVANDEALRLLGLDPARDRPEGRPVRELPLPATLADLLADGRPAVDELHVTRDAVVVVNQATTTRDGERLGTVTTLRDQSELQALNRELDSVRSFSEALRAQAHENSNRLHTVVTLIELGRAEDAVEFATAELASTQQLADRLLAAVEEPVLAALLLGKAAEAHERGVDLVVSDETSLGPTPYRAGDLVTVVGNLVDNAVEAVLATDPPRRVEVLLRCDERELVVRVGDTGPGIAAELAEDVFRRGWSTKSGDRLHGRGLGLALVRQVVDRYGGVVEVGGTGDGLGEPRGDRGGAVLTVRLPLPVGSRA